MGVFNESAKWRILSFYFANPSKKTFVKELARTLKISPATSSYLCAQLHGEGTLLKQKMGNSLFYCLDNGSPVVRRLKSAWGIAKLTEVPGEWDDAGIMVAALYGSFASGEFLEKSDVDLLFVALKDKKELIKFIPNIEKRMGREVNMAIFSPAQWMELARKKDPFYLEVIANHVLLKGESLSVS